MKIARRGMLRALVAAPFGAHAAAEQVKTALLTSGVAAGLPRVDNAPRAVSGQSAPMRFMDFREWFAQIGEREIRRNAKHITGFDPDLIDMRLPMATKVRMQQDRNYKRMVEDRRDWFQRRLTLHGIVEDWP